jgi:peptidoglycan/LPS O-acetylase OafA/YrhL
MRLGRFSLFFTDLSKGRAIELDAIRGLAIVLAMGWHLNKPTGNLVADAILAPGSLFGWAGVDLFFVLSGFLIGGLLFREMDATGDFRSGRFLARRALRLWPVLYLFLVAQLFLTDRPATDFVPQVFFHVQNYFHTPISHLWSLAVEEQFYFLSALVLPFVARRRAGTKALVWGIGGLALVSFGLRSVMWLAGEPHLNLEWETQYRADALLVGVLLALVKQRRGDLYALRPRLALAGLALACAVGLAMLQVTSGEYYRALLGFPLATLLGASLIGASDGLAIGRRGRALLLPLSFMGLYSYSIYIWHNALGRRTEEWVTEASGSALLAVAAAYVVVVAGSVVVTRLVERPMIELRNRLFPSLHAATAREASQDAALTAPRAEA